ELRNPETQIDSVETVVELVTQAAAGSIPTSASPSTSTSPPTPQPLPVATEPVTPAPPAPVPAEPAPASGKRIGLFFGVGHYEFDQVLQAMGEKPLSLPACENDPKYLADALATAHGLDEARVFINGEVTKARMHDEIANGLPGRTKSGDTVV